LLGSSGTHSYETTKRKKIVRRAAVVLATAVALAAVPVPRARGTAATPARPVQSPSGPLTRLRAAPWAPGRVLVEFRHDVAGARARRLITSAGATIEKRIPMFGTTVVGLGPGIGVPAAVARFAESPMVRSAQPDWLLFPHEAVPDDARFSHQWGLRNMGQAHPLAPGPGDHVSGRGKPDADVDASNAWDIEQGERTVIAILDSGVDVDHPDLQPNLWNNLDDPVGGGDEDGNGYVDDVHGWDFAEDDANLLELDSSITNADHGTHVAGIAAASSAGSAGIVGACPGCRIMALKFMSPVDTDGVPGPDTMAGFQSAELEALAYARREGADIVNASFGSLAWSALERRAYHRLIRAGVLPIVAAGNWNGDNDMYLFLDFDLDGVIDSASPFYPASYDLNGLVSVAASNHRDQYGFNTACALERGAARWPCTFTNWGHDSVDLAAPGVDILSTVPGGGYRAFDGTSMAAPLVSGVAGLIKSAHPLWRPLRIRNVLLNSVDKRRSLRRLRAIPGRPASRGGLTRTNGRMNARRALSASSATRYQRPDSSILRARRLERAARGRVWWPSDVNDVHRKWLRKGRRYRIVLRGARGRNVDLFVYKPGTLEIWQIEASCLQGPRFCKLQLVRASPRSTERATFRPRRSGVYYFQVSSFFARGKYTLRVTRAQ
jgi:subtilisin family serine protease